MTLVNTQGMAFIGPGSEWFWTAVSGLVLAITFIAIYRQLRLQRDAEATRQLTDLVAEWSSERMARAKLAILQAIQAGVEPPDRAQAHIGYFWQKFGYLVRSGHMDRSLVYEQFGDQVQAWWAWLVPERPASIDVRPVPGGWTAFEWLAATCAALDVRRGADPGANVAVAKGDLSGFIEHYEDAIELEEALRTVPVRAADGALAIALARTGAPFDGPTRRRREAKAAFP